MPLAHEQRACAAHRLQIGHADVADGFTLPGAERHYPPDLELDPVHLDIDVRVDLVAQSVGGTVTHTVEARRGGRLTLKLDAVAFEDVRVAEPVILAEARPEAQAESKVQSESESVAERQPVDAPETDGHLLTWQYDGRVIQIQWAEPFTAGERRRVAVTYNVVRPASGLYFMRPTDAYPGEPWFAATDHETERARHWLPCVDLANARPRVDFHLRAEQRFTILAGGAPVGDTDHGDGTHTAHWHLDYPCPSYLTCFAIGDFVRCDDGAHAGVPIAYFTTPPFTPDDLRRAFGRTGAMLAWMTRKLDMPFPFPKYYQFALLGFGGAMENISLVSWDDSFVLDETLALEWTRLVDEINVHEMAHSYFGDAVVCREQAHSWLKESWATFIEQVWFEDNGFAGHSGQDEQRYQYWRDAQAYFGEADDEYMRPIVTREFNSSWDMYDRHLYPGGACRLHTLRAELGDDAFWAGVRAYLKRYAGGVVETDDFRRVMEEHSGRSLVKFFEQWFYSPGYPKLKVTFSYDAERHEGTFEVEQTQGAEGADVKSGGSGAKGSKAAKDAHGPGLPVFELSTDVGWTVNGAAFTRPVKLTKAKHTIVVPMPAEPEQVRFDPACRALHKLEFNPGNAKLRRQLTAAADVIGRIQAAQELAKTGAKRNLEAVRDAYLSEPFWGVRVEMAKALAKAAAASDGALDALAGLAAYETDPLAMEAVFRAAGKVRDGRIRHVLEARLEAGLPYRATQAALEGLGAQRDDAPFERLAAAAATDGFGGIAQSGALRALAATRRPEAIGLLLDAAGYGRTTNRARPAAVAALGELGRLQEKEAHERIVVRLADLLRDPNLRVRRSAAAALGSAGATGAIAALEAYQAPLSVQEQVGVDWTLARIRRRDRPAAAALEKQVDELRAKLRKLQGTVDKLEARVGVPADSGKDTD